MNIKIVLYNFIYNYIIGIINTVVIYQIKENNLKQKIINNLVFMQERK